MPEPQSPLGAGARKRTCTNPGGEFFLSTVLKSRDKSHKKILKHVGKLDDLLERQSLEDAKILVDILNVDHKEFIRSHIRYQELSDDKVDSSEQKVLLDDVQQLVTNVKERLTDAITAHHRKSEVER